MNKLSSEQRVRIIAALVEGVSIRAICRMTGAAKGTVLKLFADAGNACWEYQDKTLVNIKSSRVQVDEIWSFCYSKQKNVPKNLEGKLGYGDVWTFVAIDADTKLAISWLSGLRNMDFAYNLICDLKKRLANRVQLTTDGHGMYLSAIKDGFGCDVDYAQLVKVYGQDVDAKRRYSPPVCLDAIPQVIQGEPDPKYISTSFIERQNLTMRMSMRRFTRLTNAFSKKMDNLEYAVALHFMYYNFCRIHQTLTPKASIGVTPAMAAGIANRIWTIQDIVKLLD